MKLPPQKRREIASAALTQTLLTMLGCFALLTLAAFATDPSWWSQNGTGSQPAVAAEQIVTNDGIVSTNYVPVTNAVVVQGQLKQFTARAVDELNATLPGGAGSSLTNLVYGWHQDYATNDYSNPTNMYAPYKPGDFTVITVGQLKSIANMVYSRLSAAGYTNLAPTWLPQNTNSDNSVAVLGQLKQVFDFDISLASASTFVATPGASGAVNLNWTTTTNNTAPWIVEEQNPNGTWMFLASLASTNNSYSVSGLTNGQSYNFQVFASGTNNVSTIAAASGTPSGSTAPTLSPPPGRYISSQTVTVTTTLSGATIYYTTDGTDPTTDSLSVSSDGELTVNANTLYKFIAISGDTQSSETTALYRIEGSALVQAGDSFSMVAKSDGSIWTWGDNSRGQMGDEQAEGTVYVPQEMTGFGEVTSLAAAGDHALAAKSNGTVWAWGADDVSQCGDGGTTDLLVPTQIGLTNIVSVYAAQEEGFAVDNTGNLHAWGANSFGQLGNGTTNNQPTPQLISGISNVVKIAASPSHTLALKSDGTVWSCGTNQWNQLGNVSSSNTTVFQQIPGLCNIIDIAAGGDSGGGGHSLALRADGAVFAWGIDFDGELGDDNPGPGMATPEQVLLPGPAVAVTAVDTKCYVLLADGTMECFGGNPEGEMGNGNTEDQLFPAQPVGTANNISQISAGMFDAIAATTTGALEGWGLNGSYLLTQDFSENYERASEVHDDLALGFQSVVSDENTTIGLKPDGTVWAAGEGYFGTTGQGGSSYSAGERFQQVSGLSGITQIAGGENDAFAIDVFGNLWAWGNDGSGQLGNGSQDNTNTPTQVTMVQDVVGVAGGTNHTLIVESNGMVWATGDDSDEELGDGTTNAETSPIQVTGVSSIKTVAAGSNTSFALDSTGAVWAWGANGSGQLGLGGTSDVATPTKITTLPTMVAISAWYNSAVGIDSSGNVWSWGDMGNGDGTPLEQSGLSNIVKVASGSGFQLAIDSNGNLWGWGNSGSGQLGALNTTYSTPAQLGDIQGAIGVAANAASTLILKQDGTVSGLGACSFGELAAQQGQYDYLPRSLYGVALAETPPTVSLTSPTAGASCPMGTAIQLEASASASSGTITEVDYYLEGVKVATSTAGGTWTCSYFTQSYGDYTFEAVAIDSAGASTVSAPVTINVPYDSDGNGLPDWWELKYFGQLGNNPSASSPGGDGNTILQDFQQGISPTAGGDISATLSIVSGNNQTGASGAFLANPLVVNVTDDDGMPLENTPVQFTVSPGNGLVGMAPAGSTYQTVSVTTDSNGMAEVYFQQPLVANSTNTLTATLATASNSPSVTFSATTPADSNAPAATTDFSAVSIGGGEIDLSWTNNADNASNILVQQQNADGSWSTTATLTSSQDSYAATGLTVGDDYNFQLVAENTEGTATTTLSSTIQATSTNQTPPQYVVVDMGAGLFPVKITNSEYVLLKDSSGGFYRWATGTTSPLTVPSGYSLGAATDITEDGTVVGTGTDASGNPALLTWTGTATVAATSAISGQAIDSAYIDASHDVWTTQTTPANELAATTVFPDSSSARAETAPTVLDGYYDNGEIGQNKSNVGPVSYPDYLYFYYVLDLEGGIEGPRVDFWTTGNTIVPLGVNKSGTAVFTKTNYTSEKETLASYQLTWPQYWTSPEDPPASQDEPDNYTPVTFTVSSTGTSSYYLGSDAAQSGIPLPSAPTALNNDGCAICNNQLVNGPISTFPSGFSARSLNAAHNSSGSPAYQVLGYDDAGDLQLLQMDPQNQTFDQNPVNVSTYLSAPDAALWTSLTPYFGFGLSQVIDDKGNMVCTGTNANDGLSHAILLIDPPPKLENLADPYRGTATNPGHNNQDKQIDLSSTINNADINGIAWVAAHDPNNIDPSSGVPMPRMPELQASIAAPNGCQVLWKLQVTFHDRHGNPHRDFDSGDPNDSNTSPYLMTDPIVTPSSLTTNTPDQVIVPNPANPNNRNDVTSDGWKMILNGAPWTIYQDPDWTAAISQAGFFGGDAKLSVKILSSNGNATILQEKDYYFRIAGENPDPTLCKTYLTSLYGGPSASQALANSPHTWYAWAIAKDETQGEGNPGGFYNHFLNNGILSQPEYASLPPWPGHPNWHDDGTKTSGAQTDRLTGTGGYGLYQLTYESRNTTSQTADANYIMPRSWIWSWAANASGFSSEIQGKITFGQNLYNALLSNYSSNGAIQNYGNLPSLDAIIVTAYNGMYGGQMTLANRVTLNGHLRHSCWVPIGTTGWRFLQNHENYAQNVNTILNGN